MRAWEELPERILPRGVWGHAVAGTETDSPPPEHSRFLIASCTHEERRSDREGTGKSASMRVRAAQWLNRMNGRPPAARFMLVCAAGIFAVAAAVIVAKNELDRSSRTPALKVFNPRIADERYRLTKDRAELLRRMILAYQLTHGHAPKNLRDLVPEFLPGVPSPLNGTDRWEYAVSDRGEDGRVGEGFTLSFRSWVHPLYKHELVDQDGVWAMAE